MCSVVWEPVVIIVRGSLTGNVVIHAPQSIVRASCGVRQILSSPHFSMTQQKVSYCKAILAHSAPLRYYSNWWFTLWCNIQQRKRCCIIISFWFVSEQLQVSEVCTSPALTILGPVALCPWKQGKRLRLFRYLCGGECYQQTDFIYKNTHDSPGSYPHHLFPPTLTSVCFKPTGWTWKTGCK